MLLIKVNLIGSGLALHVDQVAKIKNLLNTFQIPSHYVKKSLTWGDKLFEHLKRSAEVRLACFK